MRLLTETELELMHILWSLKEGTVTEVQEKLPEERDLAYTSVSTILRILEKKEILTSRKDGRRHIYKPLLSKEEYEAFSLNTLLERVFTNAPTSLVRTLVDTNKLTPSELEAIQILIAKKLEKK